MTGTEVDLSYAEDTADMSDSETMCSVSDMSDISDTTAVVYPVEHPALAVDRLYYLEAPAETYLAQKRYTNFKEYKKNNPRNFALLPPPFQVEFAFNDFVKATSRAYLTAQATPPSRTPPGTRAEFQAIGRQLDAHIDTSVPLKDCGQLGNGLEVKRMVLTSVLRFAEVWQEGLPDGVEKVLLFRDVLNFIHKHAKARRENDRLEEEAFPYHEADWREVLESDLEVSQWMRWKEGAL
ncbi:hypothetical protein PQX77_017006 [Marasmius sp. AFHP31]|nr:hypothetical protein PQX77_017006 [Marasmius sp. AFHP31]